MLKMLLRASVACAFVCLLAITITSRFNPLFAQASSQEADANTPAKNSAKTTRQSAHAKNRAARPAQVRGSAASSGPNGNGSAQNGLSGVMAPQNGNGIGNGQGTIPPPDLSAHDQPFVPGPVDYVTPTEFNGDVRNLPAVPHTPRINHEHDAPFNYKSLLPEAQLAAAAANAALSAPAGGSTGATGSIAPNMPSTSLNFDGLSFSQSVTGGQAGAGWPPDPNGTVGMNQIIEAVNDAYGIYNKSGTLLAAFTENQLWSAAHSGTPCDANNFGDPIVVYDPTADRWILTNFAFGISGGNPVSPFYQCFAVSKSGDPVAGGWYFYPIRMDTGSSGQAPVGTINDYPKFGIWNDSCLYLAANGFQEPSGFFSGTFFGWLNKNDMYAGATLRGSLGFIANSTDPFTMVPATVNGRTPASLPPAGRTEFFVSESQTAFAFEVRAASPGANCVGGSLGAAANVSQASYGSFGGVTVSQPNTSNLLDWIDDRIMQKVQYRNVGGTESLWVVHNVRPSTSVPVKEQWAQISIASNGTINATPVQQQIFSTDNGVNRWMGSIAADSGGNAALGFSTSGSSSPNFPSIRYTGRLSSDALNTMPQGESFIMSGGGSQTNSCGGAACHRWGDYSAMTVDPADDCTFWYVNEYYDTQTSGNAGNWHTRIANFNYPSCTPVSVDLTISKSHSGSFTAGGTGSYNVTVSNAGTALSLGLVTVTEAPPTGLTVASMTGTGWNCTGSACTRSDQLAPGASYPAITVNVNVASNAPSSVTNSVTVSGGGDANSSNNTANDVTSITSTSGTVAITVTTSPAGLAINVDGTALTAPQSFNWVPGSNHTIATSTPQPAGSGAQYAFTSWSDAGALSHSITTPSSATTYTASFNTQYQLTTAASPSVGGTVTPASGTFYNSGTVVNLQATANSGYVFKNWSGSVANANNASTTVTMSGPQLVTANFKKSTVLTVSPASGSYGGTAALSATLTDGTNGIANESISFTLNGSGVGSAMTNSSGVASIASASLTGINAGTYSSGAAASFAGDTTYDVSNGSAALTVNKANQTISFGALANHTYGDPDFTVSATASSALTVSFAASGNCSMPNSNTVHITGAGSCTVTASQAGNSNYNAATSVPQSFTIAKANATIVVTGYSVPFDGNPHTATGSATGVFNETLSGLDLSGTTHTATGTYTDPWTFTDSTGNYNNASGTVSDSIGKQNQTITFGALANHTYGDPDFTVSATASSGLTVTFAASGSCSMPNANTVHITGAGSCTVTASQAGNSGYNPAPNVPQSFTTAKANATIVVTPYNVAFDGNPHTATGTATGVFNEALTGLNLSGTTHTAVGTYGSDPWTFTDSTGNYNNTNGTVSDTIGKANQTISFGALPNHTYGDPDFTVSATASSGLAVSFAAGGNCTMPTGNTVHITGAGSCTVTASQAGNGNYNAAPSMPQSFTIAKANATIVVTPYNVTFDGNPHTATGSATGVFNEMLSGLNLSGTTHTAAGNYTDPWTFTDSTGNYNNASGNVNDVISAKQNQTITFAALPNHTWGDPDFTVSATASSGLPVSFAPSGNCSMPTSNTVHITGAGSCTITASQSGNATYNAAPNVPQSFNIAKANATIVVTPYNVPFDGNPHTATGTATGVFSEALSGLNLSGTTHTAVGTYSSDPWTFTDSTGNYNNANGTVSDSIGKANQTISFGALPNHTWGDPDFSVSATASSGLAVSFAPSGNCTMPTSSTVHITGAGSCTITASQAGNSNYNAATNVPQSFTIAKANATIVVTGYNVAFDGNPHTATGSATGVFNEALSGLNLSGTTHTAAGTYNDSWTFTDSTGNYNNAGGSVTDTITGGSQQSQTITFPAIASQTWGNPDFNISATASSGLPVSFSASGACTVSGNLVHITAAGFCTITASQAGNGTYAPAPNVSQTVTIFPRRLVAGQYFGSTGAMTYNASTGLYSQTVTITNSSGTTITGPITLVVGKLTAGVTVVGAIGVTDSLALPAGDPYLNMTNGNFAAGTNLTVTVVFSAPPNTTITWDSRYYAGPGVR